MSEREAVVVPADLADEDSLRRILEQPRLVRAVVDVDVALRVGRDAHVLAGVDAGRVLEEIRHGLVRNHRHVGGRGPVLRRDLDSRLQKTDEHARGKCDTEAFHGISSKFDRHFITHRDGEILRRRNWLSPPAGKRMMPADPCHPVLASTLEDA
jgi:hypothetical protein